MTRRGLLFPPLMAIIIACYIILPARPGLAAKSSQSAHITKKKIESRQELSSGSAKRVPTIGVKSKRKQTATLKKKVNQRKEIIKGTASWYGGKFHGKKTASTKRYNKYALTAAHRTLPFGTKVQVINPDNGKSVWVEIIDRGPFKPGRIIDLTPTAMDRLCDGKRKDLLQVVVVIPP